MPSAREVVVMVSAGATTTVADTDFVESLTDVAVIATVILAETLAGAL